jgi:hypothetical protein|tara:strand:- start:1265 stop:1414 length:150 start_codon:yes stop_codon:yes gene_type:complete
LSRPTIHGQTNFWTITITIIIVYREPRVEEELINRWNRACVKLENAVEE